MLRIYKVYAFDYYPQVRNAIFVPFIFKNRSFCQDRLKMQDRENSKKDGVSHYPQKVVTIASSPGLLHSKDDFLASPTLCECTHSRTTLGNS